MTTLLMFLCLLSSPQVVLKSAVDVDQRYIRLVDIVDLKGFPHAEQNELRMVYLGRAPELGLKRTITREDIQKELLFRGFEVKRMDIQGETVVVHRVKSIQRSGEILHYTLPKKISAFIAEKEKSTAEQYHVTLLYVNPDVLEEDYSVQSIAEVGSDSYELTCLAGDEQKNIQVYCTVQVIRKVKIYVAKHHLPNRTVVDASDFEVRYMLPERKEEVVDATLSENIDSIGGSKLKRNLNKGERIRHAYLEMPKIIHKGDIVSVSTKYVTAEAIATADGALGEVIDFKIADRDITILGKIISSHNVEVVKE